MATAWKGTLFFSDYSYGWTETWWLKDHAATDAGALSALDTLASFRKEMLGFGARLPEIRVSNETYDSITSNRDAPAESDSVSPNASSVYTSHDSGAGSSPFYVFNSLQPFDVLEIEMYSPGALHRKKLFLAGLPEFLWDNPWGGDVVDGPGTWKPLYFVWLGQLKTDWGFRVLLPKAFGAANTSPITAIGTPDDRTVALTCDTTLLAGGTPKQGSTIHVNGLTLLPRHPRVSGNYRVLSATATTITIAAANHLGQVMDPNGREYCYVPQYDIVSIEDARLTGWGNHRRGRTFFPPPGRHRRP